MTGKGQPDVATRIFLNKARSPIHLGEISALYLGYFSRRWPGSSGSLRVEHPDPRPLRFISAIYLGEYPINQVRSALNIPILGLFDSDPYGLKILSVYMKGSKNMS